MKGNNLVSTRVHPETAGHMSDEVEGQVRRHIATVRGGGKLVSLDSRNRWLPPSRNPNLVTNTL